MGNLSEDFNAITCGYIKAKFALQGDKPLVEHPAYVWALTVKQPRVTQHYVYLTLGHKDIRDNEHARRLITDIKAYGGRITRLDFSIDYCGRLDFDAFYTLHDTGARPVPGIWKTPHGVTVYVGKRSSARMLRVYDKRAEIEAKGKVDIGFDLTRIELEIKRTMVTRYCALFLSGKGDVILSDIQRLYGLRGFCESHKASKPIENRDKAESVWGFITRYKRIIGCAYREDKVEFLRIIGGNDNGKSVS